jgi:hypothetical protein
MAAALSKEALPEFMEACVSQHSKDKFTDRPYTKM